MFSLYCNNFPETNLYNGKGLMLGGSLEHNNTYRYTDGDLSAILINNFPFWVNMYRSPDLQTGFIKKIGAQTRFNNRPSIKRRYYKYYRCLFMGFSIIK